MEYLNATRTTPLSEDQRTRQMMLWEPPEEHDICDGITTCTKCKSKKVTHVEKQTRSGDEGMTVFAHCRTCGNRWSL